MVEQFQNDPACKLFLISLKAGGLGLNLTAAEYVFLLDPWWNPAVEAQAIDRAHRIGQLQKVFAYRLIARDTVEEKVLALQNTKRALADAIINADNSLIAGLGREELELFRPRRSSKSRTRASRAAICRCMAAMIASRCRQPGQSGGSIPSTFKVRPLAAAPVRVNGYDH